MSLSDGEKKRTWGSVFMGTSTLSLRSVEGDTGSSWTEADEVAYLDRVKKKATEIASSLIEEARQEAETIRKTAHEQGYADGMAEADQEIEQFRVSIGDSVAGVLHAIQGQCSAIFAEWRDDLVVLLRVAAEKAIGVQLVDDKAKMLEEAYVQAVAALENRRNLIIRVNPDDEPAIADIVMMTQSRFSDLQMWSVKGDVSVSSGGLIVESEDSLADNRLEKRVALVNEVLQRLSLPSQK